MQSETGKIMIVKTVRISLVGWVGVQVYGNSEGV